MTMRVRGVPISYRERPEPLPERPEWHQHAACRQMDMPVKERVDLFFPTQSNPKPSDVALAKAMCERCKVRVECAQQGRNERWGIWGGRVVTAPSRRRRKAS